MGLFVQLDKRRAVDQGFNVEAWESYEVRLGCGGAWGGEREEGVADLFDMNCSAEGRFLGVVALQLK